MSCGCQEAKESNQDSCNYSLPSGFLLGVATSAYQIEGAWDEDGKSPNIWDTLTHQHPEYIADGSNGDVACDSYHKYKEDIQMCKELGVGIYRFSISWSRVLPRGTANDVNQAGVDYYNNLIDGLLANGIQPMVTMYHWDLPQVLQDLGGWTNLVLAQYFADYAKVLYTKFGDRVKWWITFNEPVVFISGYSMPSAWLAPCLGQPGVADLLAVKTVLLAHAKAYHLYNAEFRAKQQGKVGFTNVAHWAEPFSDSQEDMEAHKRAEQFFLGLYANPIYGTDGDFPEIVKEIVAKNSEIQGYPVSRLPVLSREEVEYIKGTADFFGFNHYTSVFIKSGSSCNNPMLCVDAGIETTQDPMWPGAASCWLKVVPWGFRKILNYISKEYNHPEIFVTENGYSDRGELDDKDRIAYYLSYMTEMLKAIHEDNCKVIGYAGWSLMDNFEWNMGYTEKFGLYHVDFNDPERKRTPKSSCKLFQKIAQTRKIPRCSAQCVCK